MRLAVFTNQFPSPVCTFFSRDMRGLLEAGIEIDIFPIYPLEPELWDYVPDILDESALPRSKVHHINLAQSLRFTKKFPRKGSTFVRHATSIGASAVRFGVEPFAKSMYAVLKAFALFQIHKDKYDHILAYWGNYSATYAYVYQQLLEQKIPFSMFLHAKIDLYTNQVYLRQKLIQSDNIIVVCEFNRQFIHDKYPKIYSEISDKIYLHHLGLDLMNFPFEPDYRPLRKIIAVGRFESQKGFSYLIHAVHELNYRGIDVEVEIVGDGPDANSLKKLVNDLHLEGRVQFKGWLHSDKVRNAMSQATILVHPSSRLGDAVPTVIKESMSLGTPVVASNIAGIPELLDNGRCGILVPPKDIKALADAIETLFINDTLRQQYAKAAREFAEEKFDHRRNGQDLAEFLRSTTRRRGKEFRIKRVKNREKVW